MVETSNLSSEKSEARDLISAHNRKNKKSGGFQVMGLSYPLYKGILKKGYKVPTPIQRKTIPHILSGRDVVAMARTGSGKTAAFLIPLMERLRGHQTWGARALILSPTRELAKQTLDFCRQLGRFTDLTAALILGGESMDSQFSALHSNPDILIASPGRLLHLLTEMNAKLSHIQCVVLDECDRLFELGFQDQILMLFNKLPSQRQTLLFSATLPNSVAEFAKVGLSDPMLIRLDLDSKLSDLLRMSFLSLRDEDKLPCVLFLLLHVIPSAELTLIFVATKHHVEWLFQILEKTDLPVTYLYSSLDPAARREHTAAFSSGKKSIMVTTDLAARGLDLPKLNNVINFHFPSKEKLFVHRVGRVARAGKSGYAISLVSNDELPYLYDLQLFLGARQIHFLLPEDPVEQYKEMDCVGSVPDAVLDQYSDFCLQLKDTNYDIESQLACAVKAYAQYLKSRPKASREAVRKCKTFLRESKKLSLHPIFSDFVTKKDEILNQLKGYKSRATIFETKHATGNANVAMAEFRKKTSAIIGKFRNTGGKAPDWWSAAQQRQSQGFISYSRDETEKATERGLALDLRDHTLDIVGDELTGAGKNKGKRMWDRKKKKFVSSFDSAQGGNSKKQKIKTEDGKWIPASFKTDRYEKWKKRNAIEAQDEQNQQDEPQSSGGFKVLGMKRKRFTQAAPKIDAPPSKKLRRERKGTEEIIKSRKTRQKNSEKHNRHRKKKR